MDLLASVIAQRCRTEGKRRRGKKQDKNIFSAKRLNDACVRDKNLEQKITIFEMLVYVEEEEEE